MANLDLSKLENPIEKYFSKIGRYHYLFFFFVCSSKIPIFWHLLSMLFLSPPMEFSCATGGNNSKNHCPCNDLIWDKSVFTKTVQTKFSVACELLWMISFSESMLYLGTLFGALLFGFFSDKFGRLNIFTICCLIIATFGCLVAVAPTIEVYIVMRFIEGFGLGGAIVSAFVLLVEYCSKKHRETVVALYHLPVNMGHVSLPGVSYLLRDCDHFQLALSLPMFLFVALRWMVYESPKWLMDSGKIEKAATTMENISKFNRQANETIRSEIEEYHASQAKIRELQFWHLFRHRRLAINLVCMCIIYFTCGMGYYGVSQFIGKMSGNIHTNVALSGLLLVPGTFASVFLLKLLSRRTFLMACNFLSGVLMLVVVCVPSHLHWVRVCIACVCNCFFFLSFMIVFLYAVELFPTSVRNSVLGFLSVLSRVGQITAPPINSLPDYASGSIFGVMALIGAALCLPLPETKDTELPTSLEDSNMLPHKRLSLIDNN